MAGVHWLSLAWGFLQRDLWMEGHARGALVLQGLHVGLTVLSYLFLSHLVEPETLARWAAPAEGYFPFVLLGTATYGAMVRGVTGLSRSLQLERSTGVLTPLLLNQTPPAVVLLLSSGAPLLRAGIELLSYLGVGWLVGALTLARANWGGAALVAGLALLAFGSLGLLAAAVSVLLRLGDPVLWAVGSASWLLSGVLYPPGLLPAPLRWAAEFFPLTPALQGLRAALLSGAALGELLPSLLRLSAFCLVMVPVGLGVFHLGLIAARVHGTLSEG